MSTYPKAVWDQLKNTNIKDLAKALEKDGWIREETRGATQGYRHPERDGANNRVVLHMHPGATKSPRILKGLLSCIAWSEDDLQRLGLIKKRKRRGSK